MFKNNAVIKQELSALPSERADVGLPDVSVTQPARAASSPSAAAAAEHSDQHSQQPRNV